MLERDFHFIPFHFISKMADKTQTIGEFIASGLVGAKDYKILGAKGARLIHSTKGVANAVNFVHDVVDSRLVVYGYTNPDHLVDSVSVDCALFVDKYTLRTSSGDVKADINAALDPAAVQINRLQ